LFFLYELFALLDVLALETLFAFGYAIMVLLLVYLYASAFICFILPQVAVLSFSAVPAPGHVQLKSKECFSMLSTFRFSEYKKMREAIDKYEGGLEAFSRGYEKKGFTRR